MLGVLRAGRLRFMSAIEAWGGRPVLGAARPERRT